MKRSFILAALLLALTALTAPAEQLKGKVKAIAADKNTLTVTVGKADQQFIIPAEARILNAAGKELPQRLKAAPLQPGALVQLTTGKVDGKDVVQEVKLLDPFPPSGYLSEAEAGPDFLVQGEYEGGNAKGKLGAQLIAQQAEGQFQVLLYRGGLPGAGWDGQAPEKGTAKTEGGKTALAAGSWQGVVLDGKLTGKTPDGDDFELKRVVRKSATEGAKPPAGAIVLFDGTNTDEWPGGKLIDGQYLLAGSKTKRAVKDFKLHLEFRLPFRDRSQGNSGVYMQERYELQIMNTYGRVPPPNNGMASIYTVTAPSLNMCYPPLSWQTYDIDFKAARWDASGKKTANAVVTLLHNGVKVHDAVEIKNKTGAGKEEGPAAMPIYLQNHGSPVYYRNIWVELPPES
ncbi:MAG: DUF1080 domain-containing protein [Planctomycetia bacterium]|nr:DUF1080 domain-containing protein [Planctomycetia bacterium]